jgi:hypothetical protein
VSEEIDEEATAVREAVRAAVMSRRRRNRRKPISEDKTENAATGSPGAKAEFRHHHVNVMREIALDKLALGAAFMARHFFYGAPM